jgi:hypothetical protein
MRQCKLLGVRRLHHKGDAAVGIEQQPRPVAAMPSRPFRDSAAMVVAVVVDVARRWSR